MRSSQKKRRYCVFSFPTFLCGSPNRFSWHEYRLRTKPALWYMATTTTIWFRPFRIFFVSLIYYYSLPRKNVCIFILISANMEHFAIGNVLNVNVWDTLYIRNCFRATKDSFKNFRFANYKMNSPCFTWTKNEHPLPRIQTSAPVW